MFATKKRKPNAFTLVLRWTFAVAFTFVGFFALVGISQRPDVPPPVELSALEQAPPLDAHAYRTLDRHLALYQATALDLGSGDPSAPDTRVSTALVPVLSQTHPLVAELEAIGEAHGGVENVPATELPPLDDVKVFVRTRQFRRRGEVPTSAQWIDTAAGQVRYGERAFFRSERELLQSAFPNLSVDELIAVRTGTNTAEMPITLTTLLLGLWMIYGAYKRSREYAGTRSALAGEQLAGAAAGGGIVAEPSFPEVSERSVAGFIEPGLPGVAEPSFADVGEPSTAGFSEPPLGRAGTVLEVDKAPPPAGCTPGPIPPAVAAVLPPGGDALGEYLKTYEASAAGVTRASIMLIVFMTLAGICVAMPYAKPPQPGEEGLIFGMFNFFAAVCALFGVGLFAAAYNESGKTFHLFEEGVVEVVSGASRAVRFDRIALCRELQEFKLVTLDHIHIYSFELDDGTKKLSVDNGGTRQAAELGDYIQERAYDGLLPKTISALQSGRTLQWGRLCKLTREGVHVGFGGNLYRWNEIRSMDVSRLNGCLTIDTGGRSVNAGVMVDAIPNYMLLFALPELLRGRV